MIEGFALIESLAQDLRFALRTLRRSPGFTLVFVVTLALGVGSNVAMWSVADAVLYRDLPYEDPDRLQVIWQSSPDVDIGPISLPTLRDLDERNRVFEAMGIFLPRLKNLDGNGGEPERLQGGLVSGNLLEIMGIEPALGRGFTAADDRPGASAVAILSYELWQRRLGGRSDILSEEVRLDDRFYKVVGVLPEGLSQETLGLGRLGDFWLPIGLFRDELPFEDRAQRLYSQVVGRVAASNSLSISEDLTRISQELGAEHPMLHEDSTIRSTQLRQYLNKDDRLIIHVLLAAVGLVWVIASANLINLQLTHLARRGGELVTRLALGARRSRLLRQLTVEGLVLATLGGLLGFATAKGAFYAFPRLFGEKWGLEGAAHSRALLVGVVLTLLTGLVAAILPAQQAIRLSLKSRFERLQMRASLPNKRLRQMLICLEVALALVTLVGVSLLFESLERLEQVDPGFTTENRLSFNVVLPQGMFDERDSWLQFFETTQERLETLQGVERVAVASHLPLSGPFGGSPVAPGDRALPPVSDMSFCSNQMVSASYFDTLGLPVAQGRALSVRDDDRQEAERAVVISRSLAERYWPDDPAVGKLLAFEFEGSPQQPEPQWRRVVGVAADVRMQDLRTDPQCEIYAPYTQVPLWYDKGPSPTMVFLLEINDGIDPDALVPDVRRILAEQAPELPLLDVQQMSDVVGEQLEKPRQATFLLVLFSSLAIFLVVVGVFGVVSYVVAARTREIGTRMAFGASPRSIALSFLRQNLAVACVGVLLGLLMATVSARLISGILFQVSAFYPRAYVIAALGLMVVVSVAALFPIWRAARVKPLEALRYE